MKRCYLFWTIGLLLSSLAHVQAQQASLFNLNKLPATGLVLNQNWTFYPGDDPNLARVDYEGEKGIPVNPALLLNQLAPVMQAGFGWFRLTMRVDSSLRNKTVGMMISLFGAAEIYLNGEEVYKLGKVSSEYKSEKTQAIYGKVLGLTLGTEEKQVLAVRFSHHPQNMYIKTGVVPFCLRIVLQPLNESIKEYATLVKRAYQFIACALTIELASSLLTLFFFFSFPSRKEYLYFGLYFSLNFFGVLIQSDLAGVSKALQVSVNQLGFVQIAIYLLLITATLFHLNGMYALLQLKRTKYYWFLFYYALASMITLPFMPKWGSGMPDLFFVLACFELLPTYYRAARRNFRGAWILFSSILLCLMFLIVMVTVNYSTDSGIITVLTALSLLTPALGIMIFLSTDFARTSLALKARIEEVEALSQKTLAQERDKQEIMAAQKDDLEREVQHRTSALRASLADLKAAQTQLIQSEKMASLGELTAGVAHEIQNPLNFIKNFSEVNKELLDEMECALQKEDKPEVSTIVADIKENLQKIGDHGRRADEIVKGMLQHSQTSTGKKELTDVNTLANEYLRLSYYGILAKDSTVNAHLVTDLDDGIERINVVPQDIGRVLLNLFNNAFYAVQEKKKRHNGTFEPTVSVRTKKAGNKVEIWVEDNGVGIPENIVDKVFQPFFTTKPSGKGTGLGLSLSYDIIKGHGGELRVDTKEGEGAKFIVQLPIG